VGVTEDEIASHQDYTRGIIREMQFSLMDALGIRPADEPTAVRRTQPQREPQCGPPSAHLSEARKVTLGDRKRTGKG
jgi:hypothetical protein